MKRIAGILVLLVLASSVLKAQDVDNVKKEEKIQALEIAFISRKLDLTPDEAQKFWPVYNEYKKEVRQIAVNYKNETNRDMLDFEEKILDVRKNYKNQFSNIIGQNRMNQFFKAEREFRGVLLNKIKNHPNRPGAEIKRGKRLRN